MTNYNERLADLRSSKNLLQKDIAVATNISLRAYQRYEYGEREPSVSVLIALADYYGVSLDYLVGRSDNPKMN